LLHRAARAIVRAITDEDRVARRARRDQAAQAEIDIVLGAVILFIGGAVSILSYVAASSSPTGGTYVIAGGALIVGVQRIVRGIRNRPKGPKGRPEW
jgi:hypothetical protein